MGTDTAAKKLAQIKATDFSGWPVTFWLVKKKIARKKAHYDVLRVDTDTRLQQRFQGFLKQQLQDRDFHLSSYDFNNADGDDVLFTIAADATEFVNIQAAVEAGFDNPLAKNYDELLNSWAYIALFENGGKRLYACRKISAETQPRKVKSKSATFFQHHKLVDIDEKEIFLIDPRYDFFVFEDTIFIAHKRQFESAMNFREGMIANGAEVLSDFEKLKLVDDVKIIREYVGTNLHHLRKLSSIRKSGYYKQPGYMKKLIAVSQSEKWDLKIYQDKIVVEPDTVELLLKLLNNDRLRSPINDELFDSAAKEPVPGR
ncbi:DUF4868 domain-containing protein [Bordetella petrii]|uniref:DUF4868 domain-containing protein n=1 Tax=Bordetella petrii TaxID=94624 RepID=UPI001E51F847|nr:DUF4868 domain-containing protein [Bordetella petrii]MCD0501531.1 DUF4868 domain-containing protein [Bordetella petrii]